MKCSSITNTSDHSVYIKLAGGTQIMLPEGACLKNVTVTNLEDIREKVSVVPNLTEVTTPGGGTTRLDD